jgi:general stress protein 26
MFCCNLTKNCTMIHVNRSSLIFLISLIPLSIPLNGTSQIGILNDSTDTGYIEAAREIMSEAGTCALITLDETGRPRVRTMDPFSPEEDLTVWLATNPKSRKVGQIRNDARVTLYYLDKDQSGYVMLHGSARLIDDQKEKAKRWKDEWRIFYANYPDDYLLIKISPEWLEVVSYSRGIVCDSITWKPPVVVIEHEK